MQILCYPSLTPWLHMCAHNACNSPSLARPSLPRLTTLPLSPSLSQEQRMGQVEKQEGEEIIGEEFHAWSRTR